MIQFYLFIVYVLKFIVKLLGPNEETIGDFWRMVWEQNSYIIVMLTKVFDFIRTMCCQYWPIETNKPVMYGPMEVSLFTE